MNAFILLVSSVASLLVAYAIIDRVLRHSHLTLLAHFVDRRAPRSVSVGTSAVIVLGSLTLPWSKQGLDGSPLIWLTAGVGLLLAWNASTRDVDPVVPGPSGGARLLLATLALLAFWSPLAAGFAALLLSARFGFWQHHAAFPMRMHLLLLAYVSCRAVMLVLPERFQIALDEALVISLLTMMVSHYVITALAKMALGPRPWSWAFDNHLHYLAACAYSWGWARFVPWTGFRRGILSLRRVEVPLQVFVFALELSCPLALLDHRAAAGFAFAFAGFHFCVWLVSGLCFWDWIATDLLVGLFLLNAPPGLGLRALLVAVTLLALFPLRHKLWKPMPLAWYDTPFTQRVHWFVEGVSGREYRLDNGFMCPHERLYGKVHGCFAIDAEVLTYHLGECFRPDLRDAILAAGPDRTALARVRLRFGIRTRSEQLTAQHVEYLQAFFALLNAGAKKAVLPSFARFLKAPGDQMFYWGDGPAYARQEPVSRVRLVYREEYFDGTELARLCDEEVLVFDVPDQAALAERVTRELTPRQMDDYLLGLAAGRLIRVSGARGRYLTAEDEVRTL